MNGRTLGIVLVIVASACFGTLAIFGRYATVAGLNVTTLLTFRFILGTAFLWLGLALVGRAVMLRGRALRIAGALGLLYALFSGLFFWGLLYIPAGVAGITFYTFPVIVYVLSIWLLDEELTRRKAVALCLALSGVALIVAGDTVEVNIFGILLVFLAACGYAGYITGSRAALATIRSDLLAGTALIATAISFLLFGTVSGRLVVPSTTEQWLIIGGISIIGTAVPLLLYVHGLSYIEAGHAAILSTTEPIVTVILGIIILDEPASLWIFVGGLLVIIGVLVIHRDVSATKPPAQ